MPLISFRESLKQIGEAEAGQPIPAWPGGFHSSPRNLKSAMHAMKPPLIEAWSLWSVVSTFENLVWTEECQGMTSDGQSWFIVSNNENERAIHKFTLNFTHLGKANFSQERHIGAPGYHDGRIFVPVEGGNAAVWVLDTNLNTLGVTPLGGAPGAAPQKGSMPWCAIHPWNGFLYSSIFGGDDPEEDDFGYVDRVYAYDPNNNFTYKGDLLLKGPTIHNVQGGCFSNNGHLYLTSDSTQEILAYSALNGAFLGASVVPYAKAFPDREEMEGITILHWNAPSGLSPDVHIPTYVHVMILDNDWPDKSDVYLKHFTISNPDVL